MRHDISAALAGAVMVVLAGFALPAVAADSPPRSGRDFGTVEPTRFALSLPGIPLSDGLKEQFFKGRSLFRQSWLVAPAQDSHVDGLGPVYNRVGCVACHLDNGRGTPPAGPGEAMHAMLVRLSIPGTDAHGGPNPHPAYGDQLNENGIPGVPGEGRAAITWHETEEILPDGERISMRRPSVSFPTLNFGPLGAGAMVSARVAPHLFGLGLLEAVKEETILGLADPDDRNRDGIRGRPNFVWDGVAKRRALGRFGLKSNVASIREEVTGSFTFDLGITTPMFPAENCTPAQTACRAAPTGGSPEMTQEQVDAAIVYFSSIGIPARRDADAPAVLRGERLFADIGCSACHLPSLRTGPHRLIPQMADRIIHPYTDLLLHDMGEDLSDGRPDFAAGPRDWRTTPLWGVGLAGSINEHANYLHDGRARTLAEAILWHGGEGAASRDAFRNLPKAERNAVIDFLRSL